MKGYHIILTLVLLFVVLGVSAQEHINPEDRVVDLNSPTFVPMVHIGKAKVGQDSVQYVRTNTIYIYLLWSLKTINSVRRTIGWCII